MYSRKTLGTVALIALATAAVSFAVVDVTTSIGSTCEASAAAACEHTDGGVPIIAITSAALGFLALGAGILPAVMWIVASVQANRTTADESDDAIAREHRVALHGDDLGLAAPLPGQARPASGMTDAQRSADEHDELNGSGHA